MVVCSMKKSRIEQEKKVLKEMVKIYCNGPGHGKEICENCKELIEYANQRLDVCKFGDNKPFCSKCTIHCYKQEMRELVKQVMRYSGPRMLIYNPLMALKHLIQK